MFQPKPTPHSVLSRSLIERRSRPARLSDEDALAWLAVLRQKSIPNESDRALITYLERGGRSVRP